MRFILVLIVLSFSLTVTAQTVPAFELISLKKTSDYKLAEPFALQTANYILSTPVVKDNKDRNAGYEFLIKWLSGTPDYAFSFDDQMRKIVKDDADMMGTYFAAYVKYMLDNKANAPDLKSTKAGTLRLLIAYCTVSSNKLKLNKQLKNYAEADKQGKLESVL